MQKLISILLLVFYTSIQAVGLSFNLHYCGDDITDINILEMQADCCCADYDNSDDDCCDDEQVYAKITKEHSATQSLSIEKFSKSIVATTTNNTHFNPILFSKTNKRYSLQNSLLSKQSSWLTFSTLRL